jgi:hypothetical protein
VSLKDDPWHSLSCYGLINGELSRRHHAVVDAIGRVAWLVGAQVRKEVEGLDPNSVQRPDLQIGFPGRLLLTDVVISHSLTAAGIERGKSRVLEQQGKKNRKYAAVASRIGAELLNVSVDSCGGMATDATRLIEAISEEGERFSMGTWTSGEIARQLMGAIATAVQRGNALAMLAGYTRAIVDTPARRANTLGRRASVRGAGNAGIEDEVE